MKSLIGSTIAWVLLFGVRIALEWLANQYEVFGKWLTVATIALIVMTVVFAASFINFISKQFKEVKDAFQPGESQQAQGQATQRKRDRERGETRAERRAQKAARAARREAERDKIQRIEAYEKRRMREIKEANKNAKKSG